jgi:DNA polymerase I
VSTWLILDCNYLLYRAFHAMGGLSYEGTATGATYGFLRDLVHLQEDLSSNKVVFCFDHGRLHRESLLSTYKASRKKKRKKGTPEEKRAYKELQRQIETLKMELLFEIGYRNVLYQEGYEADDIIASVCKLSLSEDDTAIIVSADKDLYQLLNERVSIWHPQQQRMLTEAGFRGMYDIDPAMWPEVKAIAGCPTDDIPGCDGVAELTAIKFIRRKLKQESVAYKRIIAGAAAWQLNVELTLLPYPGVKEFRLRKDKVSSDKWAEVADRYGMKSLRRLSPFRPRGIRSRS